MLLAAIAFAQATGDVVSELLRFPAPPIPPDPGPPPKCCECRSQPVDLPKSTKMLAGSNRATRMRASNQLAEILRHCYVPQAIPLLSPLPRRLPATAGAAKAYLADKVDR